MRLFVLSLVCLMSAGFTNLAARNAALKSPDGKIIFELTDDGDRLNFNVTKSGVAVIEKSPLMFMVDGDSLTKSCVLSDPRTYSVEETYPTRGAHSMAVNKANGMTMEMKQLVGKEICG